ncbi:helix-turn-helix domain-containing protein [Streptomyces sp. NPDC046805]|uniref:winged helix-turn-helix transcriptional regulator n=1 Tax=Streptomyces sp. NPDC046805 TaxID=3155134 RepID=UPI0033D58EB0
MPPEPKNEDFARIDDEACRKFIAGIELAGKRWSASILLAAARGAERYSEYHRMIEGISQRLLAQRLRELTEHELLQRDVIPTTPVQVRYTLSGRGRELLASLVPLIRWGQKWDPEPPARRKSATAEPGAARSTSAQDPG